MKKRLGLAAALLATTIVTPAAADSADEPTTKPLVAHFHYNYQVLARMNPLGLEYEALLSYRIPVSRRTDSPLWKDTFVAPILGISVSPAAFRPVIGFEGSPIRVLTFFVRYEPAFYFGAIRSLLSYPSANADSPSGYFVSGPEPNGKNYGTTVHQFSAGLTLQAETKRFFARTASRGHYEIANLHDEDRVYYDSTYDILVYRKGWVFENDTDVGVSVTPHLKLGIRYATILTWYPASAYGPGEPHDNVNSPIMRTGPIAQYELAAGKLGPFASAAVFGTANWFVEHRYRTGEAVSNAAPFIGGGFSFAGDL